MKIHVAMVEVPRKLNPIHEECVTVERGQRVLCVCVLGDICGMLMLQLLHCKKFRSAI